MNKICNLKQAFPKIHPTTACFPGLPFLHSIRNIFKYNIYNPSIIQICPQQVGTLSPFIAETISSEFLNTKFRMHANVSILNKRFIFDCSSDINNEENISFLEHFIEINKILKQQPYSLHAGRRKQYSLDNMIDNAKKIQDFIGVKSIIEGLYPDRRNTWFMNSIEEYEYVAHRHNFVLDLSHVLILFNYINKPFDINWCIDMINHPNCNEVHVSSNNLIDDSHSVISGEEPFLKLYPQLFENKNITIFSEENFSFK